jgi:hypothetical protein
MDGMQLTDRLSDSCSATQAVPTQFFKARGQRYWPAQDSIN